MPLPYHINKTQLLHKRGIYIYGAPGSGKTEFVISVLKELDYDVVKYDTGDIRNKSIIDNITKNNMSDKSILSLFHKKYRCLIKKYINKSEYLQVMIS